MDAAIPADAQNAPTGIWKSRTEREIPTAPTPIIVVVNERKNNGDSNSVAKPSTESDQAQIAELQRRAEALGGERNVPYNELFTSSFMAKHTGFETLQAMWDASGLFVATESEEDCRKILVPRRSEFDRFTFRPPPLDRGPRQSIKTTAPGY